MKPVALLAWQAAPSLDSFYPAGVLHCYSASFKTLGKHFRTSTLAHSGLLLSSHIKPSQKLEIESERFYRLSLALFQFKRIWERHHSSTLVSNRPKQCFKSSPQQAPTLQSYQAFSKVEGQARGVLQRFPNVGHNAANYSAALTQLSRRNRILAQCLQHYRCQLGCNP